METTTRAAMTAAPIQTALLVSCSTRPKASPRMRTTVARPTGRFSRAADVSRVDGEGGRAGANPKDLNELPMEVSARRVGLMSAGSSRRGGGGLIGGGSI